jgi:hypothetical protein
LDVGEISGIIKGVSVLSERELSMVVVSEVDDDDDDLSPQLVKLRDGVTQDSATIKLDR